jgi:hypothetical protein
MTARTPRNPLGKASVGSAVLLMAVGGVLAFGVQAPASVEKYVDLLDLGLILVWAGVLLLVMQVVMHRPRKPRRPRGSAYDDRTDQWYANDVHRPGYAGETRNLPTVRRGR